MRDLANGGVNIGGSVEEEKRQLTPDARPAHTLVGLFVVGMSRWLYSKNVPLVVFIASSPIRLWP